MCSDIFQYVQLLTSFIILGHFPDDEKYTLPDCSLTFDPPSSPIIVHNCVIALTLPA